MFYSITTPSYVLSLEVLAIFANKHTSKIYQLRWIIGHKKAKNIIYEIRWLIIFEV